MTRTIAVAASALMLLVLAAPIASAEQYPPGPGPVTEPNLIVTTPGGVVAVEGRGFGPGATVCIVNRSGREIGSGCEEYAENVGAAGVTATADDNGEFLAEVQPRRCRAR